VDELCLNQPPEFKEFMNYCRGLAFTADPDYKYILNLFEGCMERHKFDPKVYLEQKPPLPRKGSAKRKH
jgi:hypothetical protein